MGGPLSSLILEVYMNRTEACLFGISNLVQYSYQCHEYDMDDGFCIWVGTDDTRCEFH